MQASIQHFGMIIVDKIVFHKFMLLFCQQGNSFSMDNSKRYDAHNGEKVSSFRSQNEI